MKSNSYFGKIFFVKIFKCKVYIYNQSDFEIIQNIADKLNIIDIKLKYN